MLFTYEHRPLQKILVVDDEAVIRDMMVDILDMEGYQVEVARNGREALDILNGEQAYLVFLDLMMPVLDGRQVCLQLATEPENRQRHVLVVMSALDQLSQTAPLQIDAMMPKPFVVDDVMRIIDTYMPAPV
ncbi:response regulator [Tengunoibacter tsumagoiensis]|uniref:Sporulation initiation phosphotransferase F n=1 Tax=Tengunoibacter tsumagoiensis TaxID=2014871 RepID=A0A401ZUM1_9CHLR|nr:response regulator [Tengunoibacter tsumagoiensis]GCE10486.1 sporulation initiation phosphotransferase F [Tengunoibacter tsumagoiensis]